MIEEFKPDKQPIGRFSDSKPFSTQHITLEKGNVLFLFSDGYTDQFGGPKNKKLKASRLKEILLANHNASVANQGIALAKFFSDWKSGYEQTDDVCLLALKI